MSSFKATNRSVKHNSPRQQIVYTQQQTPVQQIYEIPQTVQQVPQTIIQQSPVRKQMIQQYQPPPQQKFYYQDMPINQSGRNQVIQTQQPIYQYIDQPSKQFEVLRPSQQNQQLQQSVDLASQSVRYTNLPPEIIKTTNNMRQPNQIYQTIPVQHQQLDNNYYTQQQPQQQYSYQVIKQPQPPSQQYEQKIIQTPQQQREIIYKQVEQQNPYEPVRYVQANKYYETPQTPINVMQSPPKQVSQYFMDQTPNQYSQSPNQYAQSPNQFAQHNQQPYNNQYQQPYKIVQNKPPVYQRQQVYSDSPPQYLPPN